MPGPPRVPQVDLDTPVTNPQLISALDSFAEAQSDAQLDALLTELNKAVYLVATLLDEAKVTQSDAPGHVVLEKGSLIKVITTSDSDGHELLPLFTDWDAIQRWMPDPVQTFVVKADDAWAFALDGYDGVIINPAGPSLPLDRPQVEELHRLANSV